MARDKTIAKHLLTLGAPHMHIVWSQWLAKPIAASSQPDQLAGQHPSFVQLHTSVSCEQQHYCRLTFTLNRDSTPKLH